MPAVSFKRSEMRARPKHRERIVIQTVRFPFIETMFPGKIGCRL